MKYSHNRTEKYASYLIVMLPEMAYLSKTLKPAFTKQFDTLNALKKDFNWHKITVFNGVSN